MSTFAVNQNVPCVDCMFKYRVPVCPYTGEKCTHVDNTHTFSDKQSQKMCEKIPENDKELE